MHETEQHASAPSSRSATRGELIEAESKRVQAADERTTQLSGEIEEIAEEEQQAPQRVACAEQYCQAKRKNLEAEDTRFVLNDARARAERQAVVQSLLARVAEVEQENQQLQLIITRCEDHMQQHLDAERQLLESRPAPAEGSESGGAPQRVAAAAQALQWVLKGKKNEVKKAQASLAVVRADESAELARLDALKSNTRKSKRTQRRRRGRSRKGCVSTRKLSPRRPRRRRVRSTLLLNWRQRWRSSRRRRRSSPRTRLSSRVNVPSSRPRTRREPTSRSS